MLEIMVSGCVYVPSDPFHAQARIRFMLELAGAMVVMSQSDDHDLYGSHRIWLSAPSHVTDSAVRGYELEIYFTEPELRGFNDRAYILLLQDRLASLRVSKVNHMLSHLVRRNGTSHLRQLRGSGCRCGRGCARRRGRRRRRCRSCRCQRRGCGRRGCTAVPMSVLMWSASASGPRI